MKKILILAFSNLKHDSRVLRQIDFLRANYTLTVVCFDSPDIQGIEIIPIKFIRPSMIDKIISSVLLLSHLYNWAYKVLYDNPVLRGLLKERSFDLILSNDIESLPLAFSLKKNARVLFDAHEYAPRHFEDKFTWRLFFQGFNKYLCKRYLPLTDAMITMGRGIAREYKKHYYVNPVIVTNANYYYPDIFPTPVSDRAIKLIHHGGANPSRQLEIMVTMMDYLDERFSLDLMLITPPTANKKTQGYLGYLKELIKNKPTIRIIPPQKPEDIVDFIKQYDIGIILVPPINFNYENGLPNKLFDFIQARLAIAVGPTIEIAEIVSQYKLGVVGDDWTAQNLASKLKTLTAARIQEFKNHAAIAAQELNAEQNKLILNDIVSNLLQDRR